MITYKSAIDGECVYLNGKRAGTIKRVVGMFGGFAYFPKKSKTHGETFSSVGRVKESLEEVALKETT